MTEATAAYKSEMDPLAAFLEDRCTFDAEATETKTALFAAYTDYTDVAGDRPVSMKAFAQLLVERGVEEGRTKSTRFWRGLRLGGAEVTDDTWDLDSGVNPYEPPIEKNPENEILPVTRHLAEAACPQRGGALDDEQTCWAAGCGYRRCEDCLQPTGSSLRRFCVPDSCLTIRRRAPGPLPEGHGAVAGAPLPQRRPAGLRTPFGASIFRMTKVPPPTDITLWDDFRHVQTRVAQALTAALRTQADLTLGEYQVLAKLAEAPGGGRRLMDLADPLGFSPSGLTQVINRLEAAGFVRRAMAADDRRGIAAVLTRAGRGRVRRATSVVTATIAEYFTDPLGASGRAVVRRACARILVSRG